jgi:uncharacterized membrane protein YhfC
MNIAARILNFSLMIAMPIVLAVYLSRKLKTEWRLFGIGVLTFILSQILHVPFNYWLLTPILEVLGLSITQPGFQLVIVGLFYGLSAGLFEEVSRYIGYSLWIKDDRDWKSALMYGIGHGGIESILLGGLVLVAFIQVIALQGTDLSTVVDADQIEIARAQIDAYWAAPWHLAILGAVERLATILFHLSATILVLQSYLRKNILWLLLAIAWHMVVDAVAVFASQTWNPYITEGVILVLGFLSLGVVFILKPPDAPLKGDKQMNQLDLLEAQLSEIQPAPPSEGDLDDSRYV